MNRPETSRHGLLLQTMALHNIAHILGVEPGQDVIKETVKKVESLVAYVDHMDAPATVFVENIDETISLLMGCGRADNIRALCSNLTDAADEMAEVMQKRREK